MNASVPRATQTWHIWTASILVEHGWRRYGTDSEPYPGYSCCRGSGGAYSGEYIAYTLSSAND